MHTSLRRNTLFGAFLETNIKFPRDLGGLFVSVTSPSSNRLLLPAMLFSEGVISCSYMTSVGLAGLPSYMSLIISTRLSQITISL